MSPALNIAPGASSPSRTGESGFSARRFTATNHRSPCASSPGKNGPSTARFWPGESRSAAAYRRQVVHDSEAYRLVAAEGDLLPSLIVDRYGEYLVVQTLSQGMEKLKPMIADVLQEQFSPAASWSGMMLPSAR